MKALFLVFIPTLTIVPATVVGALVMKRIATTALEGMTRQPNVAGQLFTSMLISLALVEALVIYCLVVSLMVAAKI